MVHPNVMIFGTTKDEKVFSLEELNEFFKSQYRQMEGVKPALERKRLTTHISEDQNCAIIAEEITLNLNSEEISNSLYLRTSCVMQYNADRWMLAHWHSSTPVETENDHWHMEEWKRENERLQKLVDKQTAALQHKNCELETEAALERIRAQVTSMKESSDLLDIVVTMRTEFVNLGHEAHYFWHMRWLPDSYEKAMTSGDGSRIGMVMTLPRHIHGDIKPVAAWEKSEEPAYILAMDTDAAVDYINKMISLGDFVQIDPQAPSPDDIRHIGGLTFVMARTTHGEIGFSLPGLVPDPPEDSVNTLIRFAGVFDLAYKRFEDLKAAERQHREAQTELALERVRARTMAMQHSDELMETSELLFEQIKNLGIELWSCGFSLWHDDDSYFIGYNPGPDGKMGKPLKIPLTEDVFFRTIREAKRRGDEFLVFESEGESLKDTYRYMDTLPVVGETMRGFVEAGYPLPTYQVTHCGFFSNGHLMFITREKNPEAVEIFKRFTRVFKQTYTRFLDLRKAEARAYESKVEASLERVRGMAAAMNHSDDLKQIAEAMFREMEILNINPLRYGIGMIEGDKKEAELWASTVDDGRYLDILGRLSLTWHPMLLKAFNAWDAQHEEFIYELKGPELSSYYQRIGEVNPDIADLEALQNPETEHIQYVSFFPFKSGTLYAFTQGEPSEGGRTILKRFASVFEQAHIRFEDLQKTEEQDRLIREERDRLEIALKELEATKDQLVQQEKLASLGQLTAGIAHEIKNPLNFVNNFSDLSVELIEELRQEIKGKRLKNGRSSSSDDYADGGEDTYDSIAELVDDIEANLKKIHEHGSRADSIVKSMLEHSRGGTGIPEPTPLNSLIKEFVSLSFHGMRAGKNPIGVDLQFDLDESIGEVHLIAEDFSRVILNLCNNAFDAMRMKLNSNKEAPNSNEFKPRLKIRTRAVKDDEKVIIEMEDNGPGIPEEIKSKILQPFFTTKKGTEGTGLGLSISNDIIKAHGGQIHIDAEEGKYTRFSIQINQKRNAL